MAHPKYEKKLMCGRAQEMHQYNENLHFLPVPPVPFL